MRTGLQMTLWLLSGMGTKLWCRMVMEWVLVSWTEMGKEVERGMESVTRMRMGYDIGWGVGLRLTEA